MGRVGAVAGVGRRGGRGHVSTVDYGVAAAVRDPWFQKVGVLFEWCKGRLAWVRADRWRGEKL